MGSSCARPLAVEAVIFDLDGTLIDSVGTYYRIVDTVLARLGYPPTSSAAIREAAGSGEFDWSRVLPEDRPDRVEAVVAAAWEISAQVAPRMFEAGVNLIPGAADILSRLDAGGVTLAIVTSTPQENMAAKLRPLEASGSLHLFKQIITADDAARKKPAPDPLVACCRRLGVPPSRAAYVGDMRVDIQAGKAAGTRTIGVLTGFDDCEALSAQEPDAIIPSVADLPSVLASALPAGHGKNPDR